MRKVDDGKKEKEKKRMAFLVATTSMPAVYRPNGYARTTTAGTPHARANTFTKQENSLKELPYLAKKKPCNLQKDDHLEMKPTCP